MKLILLSGGSGTRLWPLSNDSRSKQFLRILKNDDLNYESMVQRVWRQINKVGLQNSAFITTSKSQVEMLQSQIEKCPPLIIEPERKDTFPAIALSVSYLLSRTNIQEDEIVVVLPVDMYVEDDFFIHIIKLENMMVRNKANISLLGVTPSSPAEKYGYIIPLVSSTLDELIEVDYFVEKPPAQEAQKLIGKSALWNCGVFAFNLKYLKDIMEDRSIPREYEQLLLEYKDLKKISFDFEVLEKENPLFVVPYNGAWKDLGTWDALVEEMDSKLLGKGKISNCSNVNLINELDIPIVLVGLQNTIVAASPDGILVSDISMTPNLKDTLSSIKTKPMYEERRWGWFRVLDFTINAKNEEVLTKRICIKKGKCLSYQKHLKRTETWNIIGGEGEIVLDNQLILVNEGNVIKINAGQKHSIRANEDLEIIEIQQGELVEEDINRYALTWEEIMKTIL
ncbi:sugar phosphate nucleotidyltransferase [Paenibacillus sp. S150]|uniref:sugar phosphate nucleotidyltransferase n=1 Tax=Paenibacillus sp. S150 TaxID=2749826 RepID=UPI001C591A91|nr:sugar phosphate nucleotidyltransferase [Paenibacillus sp. S150]MBW4081588.1 mannose-1-phosphate guanylyltransferase [Paenibacillus sp. S150]